MGPEQAGKSNSKPENGNKQPKELSDEKKKAAFDVALLFAEELIEKKLDSTGLKYADRDVLIKYPQQPGAVKERLKVTVLGRITNLHRKAVEASIEGAESVERFTELKSLLCQKISLCEDELTDIAVNGLLDSQADSYLDKAPRLDALTMEFVRKAAAVVIPDNPQATEPPKRVSQQAID